MAVGGRPLTRSVALARGVADAVCLTYAQLLFSRSRAVGALLVLATAVAPRAMLTGLAAVLLSLGVARALKLAPEQLRAGQLSYNALMVGLAVASIAPPTAASAGVLAVAVVASVLVTAALRQGLTAGHGLPVLTLPFLAVFYLAAGALPEAFPHVAPHAAPLVDDVATLLPALPRAYLTAMGSIFCAPRVDAGALVLAALLTHSRIAATLSFAGFALAHAVAPAGDPALVATIALNGMLVAVALGSVWFIPSAWSYGVALVAVLVSGLVTAGLAARFERLGLPLLIVPFNLTVPLVLAVMRQRIADGRPHAVDFEPGTPEQNLAYFRSRSERFGAVLGLRLAAPFRGRWTCTQGVSGGVTHAGPWRHALDFEIVDDDGVAGSGAGATLDDFACYRLPIVAPAAGVVVRVVDGVRDNAPGDVNLDDNWGNAVIVRHAPGVFACLAHLSPGTLAVREGQVVQAGEVLGLCGNSGRSATPHLHMQLQATPELGAPTIPIELHDVVSVSARRSELRAAHVPVKGEGVRRIEPDDERARLLRFEYLAHSYARVDGAARAEELVADIDPLGRMLLRSTTTGAALYYEHTPAGFTVHDVVGDASSVLHLVRAALSRVPFDADDALTWTDRLPLRAFLPAWMRPLYDSLSPFGGPSSLAMRYAARRVGASLVIEGASERTRRDGRPLVSTTAFLAPGAGLVRLEVRVRGRALRIEVSPSPSAFSRLRTPLSFQPLTEVAAHARR